MLKQSSVFGGLQTRRSCVCQSVSWSNRWAVEKRMNRSWCRWGRG